MSDTAVIAAATQSYENSTDTAELGGTIRYRLPYVTVALILSLAVFGLLSMLSETSSVRMLAKTGAEGVDS